MIEETFAADSGAARAIDFQGGAKQALRLQFENEYEKYIDLENKKANFTDGNFVKLLNEINEQRLNGYFIPDFLSIEEQTQDIIENQALYYYRYQIALMLKYIFMPQDDQFTTSAFSLPAIDEIAGLLTNDAGEAVFSCYQSYGINANSSNKALAWAFIKFMLGEDMQQSLNLLGFPVNKAAFMENSQINLLKIPNYVSQADGAYSVNGYYELTEEKYLRAYEEYMKYHEAFVNDLSLYPVTDEIINEMVSSEAALFFDGSKSAQEVADVLQNKVQLYLSE